MSTSKATIIALAQVLCGNLGDQTEMERLYGEIELELAHDPRKWIAQHITIAATSDDAVQGDVAALYYHAFFYEGRQLLEVSRVQLEATNPNWRDQRGVPRAFTKDNVDTHLFRLYPRRHESATPVTLDFFITKAITGGIPDIMTLPLALFVCAREFSRESHHRDMQFAVECNQLAAELLNMVA